MIINIYKITGETVAENIRVYEKYDSCFYFRKMPILSAARCRNILNELCPHFKTNKELLRFEDAKTGYTGIQYLHRNGTILNF